MEKYTELGSDGFSLTDYLLVTVLVGEKVTAKQCVVMWGTSYGDVSSRNVNVLVNSTCQQGWVRRVRADQHTWLRLTDTGRESAELIKRRMIEAGKKDLGLPPETREKLEYVPPDSEREAVLQIVSTKLVVGSMDLYRQLKKVGINSGYRAVASMWGYAELAKFRELRSGPHRVLYTLPGSPVAMQLAQSDNHVQLFPPQPSPYPLVSSVEPMEITENVAPLAQTSEEESSVTSYELILITRINQALSRVVLKPGQGERVLALLDCRDNVMPMIIEGLQKIEEVLGEEE